MFIQRILITCLVYVGLFAPIVGAEDVTIPAFTGYLHPKCDAARFTKEGVFGWSSEDVLLWGGSLSKGKLSATVVMNLPENQASRLRMTIGKESHEATVMGAAGEVRVSFGELEVAADGYQTIELAGISKSGKTWGEIRSLNLGGPAAKDAFFNLKPRRNAASVHLGYPVAKDKQVELFYCEISPKADPLWTYYMACGFSRGYFGMQVNSPTERRIIFSVWDAGNEAVDRKKVADENRVKLLSKGEGVYAGDFGNEGTGGHSHLKYMWKTDQTHRFVVTAKPQEMWTTYSGYYYFNETKKWGLIASFKAPSDGKYLRGLYSFNEDFAGQNGHLRRLAEFGNQWVKTSDGEWIELSAAHFTHDSTGKDRRDYGAGVTADGRFYLSNGGFLAEPVKYGQEFNRPGGGKPPGDIPIQ